MVAFLLEMEFWFEQIILIVTIRVTETCFAGIVALQSRVMAHLSVLRVQALHALLCASTPNVVVNVNRLVLLVLNHVPGDVSMKMFVHCLAAALVSDFLATEDVKKRLDVDTSALQFVGKNVLTKSSAVNVVLRMCWMLWSISL